MSQFKNPLDKILENAAERVMRDVSFEATVVASFCESPIERLLYAALFAATRFHTRGSCHGFDEIVLVNPGDQLQAIIYDPHTLYFTPQAPVLEYRADFLILAKGEKGEWRGLVVECDGHDFHERTKEQAARDRARDRKMQAAGYAVFRFTGSEIYKDPCACADQVLTWANETTWSDA